MAVSHCRLLVLVGFSILGAAPASVSADAPDPTALAVRIDQHLANRWVAEKINPATLTDDAAFVRRVHLDLVGRIPTASEARSFIESPATDKRAILISRLVNSASYAHYWATFWRREWIPQADQPLSVLDGEFDSWLTARLRANTGYDRIVRELLTATSKRVPGGVPQTFLVASEFKPENLAANTTRAFLGINLDCAQCHDHPFARWTREQFWQSAAFFVRPSADQLDKANFQIIIADTNKPVMAAFLTDGEVNWPTKFTPDSGRAVLADWLTSAENPYFARNAVNRVWANLFGLGLVEPLDDLSGENPASHPELLEELAKAFAESGFDLQFLIVAIVRTKAYQLSSVRPVGNPDPRLFASAAVRGLTGEQLYDSLHLAAGLSAVRTDLDPLRATQSRKQFADRFRIERPGTAQRSILQSLALMNGEFTAELTDPAKSPVVKGLANAPFLDTRGKIEELYLAALGRLPTADERALAHKHLTRSPDIALALADLFWALLNSSEFSTNH